MLFAMGGSFNPVIFNVTSPDAEIALLGSCT